MHKNFEDFLDQQLDIFIDKEEELIYNKIIQTIPEAIPNDEWLLGEHIDFVIDFILDYMSEEFLNFVLHNAKKEF